jgi:hypothetical protein
MNHGWTSIWMNSICHVKVMSIITLTKSHIKTYRPYAILIKVCTHSNNVRIQGSPKMNSKSQITLKFLNVESIFIYSTYISTTNRWYLTYIFLARKNILIQWVFTILNNLLFLVLKKSTKLWNFVIFFGLWAKKEHKLCKIFSTWCTIGRFDKMTTSRLILWPKQGTLYYKAYFSCLIAK